LRANTHIGVDLKGSLPKINGYSKFSLYLLEERTNKRREEEAEREEMSLLFIYFLNSPLTHAIWHTMWCTRSECSWFTSSGHIRFPKIEKKTHFKKVLATYACSWRLELAAWLTGRSRARVKR
jgi:hypothetical protein